MKSFAGNQYYEFGRFVLDLVENRLFRDGELVSLPNKGCQILAFLIQNRGHVVSIEEISKECWEELIIEESAVIQQIYRIRKALKTDNNKENYLETLKKKGYRFNGDAELNVTEPGVRANVNDSTNSNGKLVNPPLYGSSTQRQEFPDSYVFGDEDLDSDFPERHVKSRLVLTAIVSVLILASLGLYLNYSSFFGRDVEDFESIAVLPFSQIGDRQNEKLGLGTADTLISRFSKQNKISVIPTSTVAKLVDRVDKSPAEIGRELEVDAVLAGTIQRERDIVRVNVQLISVEKGIPVWADKFDIEFSNIFSLQDEISEKVTDRFPLQLNSDAVEYKEKQYTKNAEAFEAYWMGVSFWSMHTGDSFENAIRQFERAIDKDPKFALAYAYLADTYAHWGYFPKFVPKEEAFRKGMEAAKKALELDPKSAEAMSALAYIRAQKGAADESFAMMKRSVEIKPNHTHSRLRISWMYANKGDLKNAVKEIRTARNLDPQSAYLNFFLADMLYFSGDYEKAMEFVDKSIALNGKFPASKNLKISIQVLTSRYDAAENELTNLEKVVGNDEGVRLTRSRLYAKKGKTDQARAMLEKVIAEKKGSITCNFEMGVAQLALGEEEKAVASIIKFMDLLDTDIFVLKYDPRIDPLRKNPIFAEALAKKEASLGL